MSARALALCLAGLVAAGTGRAGGAATPHSREAFVMGTRVSLQAYATTRERGLARLERMLDTIERSEAELSTWRPDSEISRLNGAAGGAPQALTPAGCRLFSEIDRLVSATGGAFDPAIGPLVAAWDLHGRGRVPSTREIAGALALGGWRRVSFDSAGCTLRLPAGAAIDVGAFGKGEALDRVRADMAEMGDEEPWIVDLGGQVAVSGVPTGAAGWAVDLADPRARARAALSLTLTGGSLATSSGSERDLQVGATRVGHILDPRTGVPAPFAGSVSVWLDRALVADALSTALFVLGPDEGLRWADDHDVAAIFLQASQDGRSSLLASRAFTRRFPEAAAK